MLRTNQKRILFILGAILAACLLLPLANSQKSPTQSGRDSAAGPRPGDIRTLNQKEREAVLTQVRTGIEAGFQQVESEVKDPSSTVALRDVSYGALAALQLGRDPHETEDLLHRAFARQNMDSSSEKYGTLPWQLNNDNIHDANSIEFGTQSWGPILLGHGKQLSSGFKKEMTLHIRAAFVALQNHKISVSYTNIYVMNTVNTILLAEAVNDHDQLERGNHQLDNWIEYTSANGIHEFDSPTYYCTTLNSLGLGYRYATQAETKAKFKAILDYFWKDIAANYFAGAQRLSGAHSRDYDFLYSTGAIDLYLATEGLVAPQPYKKLDMEKALVIENETEDGYHPAASVLAAAAVPERVVEQTWDEDRTHDRYNYITPQFAIGSANGDYGPQDKMIEVELASDKNLPGISIVPDTYDQPYGLLKTKDRSGHSKPYHSPLHPTTIQHKNVLMALLDLDPSRQKESESFATNILLPVQADRLMLDDKSLPAGEIFEKTARLNSVIGVREGNACFVARAFHADGADEQEAAFVAEADQTGLQKGVGRYTIYHYRGKSRVLTDKHVRVGLLLLADSCTSDDRLRELMQELHDAHVEDKTSGKSGSRLWDVKIKIRDVILEAKRDLDARTTLLRSINGHEPQNPNLAVNGRVEDFSGERQPVSSALKQP
jgi:hypothetical protein